MAVVARVRGEGSLGAMACLPGGKGTRVLGSPKVCRMGDLAHFTIQWPVQWHTLVQWQEVVAVQWLVGVAGMEVGGIWAEVVLG